MGPGCGGTLRPRYLEITVAIRLVRFAPDLVLLHFWQCFGLSIDPLFVLYST